MFISTLYLNSCSAVLIITQCGTASRYITGTPQKWKLFCELTMTADYSLCETQLSRVPILTPAPSAFGCPTFARLISSHAPSACLRFFKLDLEALCSELST